MVDKIRENRLRQTAKRQGLVLTKSKRRDLRATDYGLYWLVDAQTGDPQTKLSGSSLDAVESYLSVSR